MQSRQKYLSVDLIPADGRGPSGKLADADLTFEQGVLAGLKLTGFSVWQSRYGTSQYNVTFPARQYQVNGERRSFALLRPTGTDPQAQDRVRALILDAYTRLDDSPTNERHHEYDQDGRSLEASHLETLSTITAQLAAGKTPQLAPGWTSVETSVPTDDLGVRVPCHNEIPGITDRAPIEPMAEALIGPSPAPWQPAPLAQAAQVIKQSPRLDPGTVVAAALRPGQLAIPRRYDAPAPPPAPVTPPRKRTSRF